MTAPENLELSELLGDQALVGVGSGFAYHERFPSTVQDRLDHIDELMRPEARTICQLARTAQHQGLPGRIDEAMPSYVRNTVTWKKLPGRE